MKIAEHDEKLRLNRYVDAWEYYEQFLKYSRHHNELTKVDEKKITTLIADFEKSIGKDRRARTRSKVWKKSI